MKRRQPFAEQPVEGWEEGDFGRHRRCQADGYDSDLDSPVIFRGLLQWALLLLGFLVRYILDALLTPRVVDSVLRVSARWVIAVTSGAWPLLRTFFTPVLPFFLWHVWSAFTSFRMLQGSALICFARLLLHLIMDDKLIVGDLTKRDIWPSLVPVVRFCRVSSGRVTHVPQPWQCGERLALCLAMPWIIRCAGVGLLSRWFTGSSLTVVHAVEWAARPLAGTMSQWSPEWDDGPRMRDSSGHDEDLLAIIRRCYDG